MSHYVKINNIDIALKDVLAVQGTEITLDFAGSKLISSNKTIDLNNHGYVYDHRKGSGGIFDDAAWYNWATTIYDSESDELIWEGRLKKIEVDDGKMSVKLTISDYVQDLVDTVCVISLLGVTTAEAIYAILTDASYLNIPEDRIIKSGFEIGISRQQNKKIDILYTKENNQKCISVLEKLCKDSGSHLFQRENKFGYWVWEQYTGVLGTPVYDSDVLPGSYSDYTDDEKIFNSFRVAYKSGASVLFRTSTDSASESLYGSGKHLSVPEDVPDSTSASDFNVLYVSSSAALNILNDLKARYRHIKKICSFTAGRSLNYVNLGDLLDLKFKPFMREPVRVIGIKPSPDKRTIDFTCEYCNYPEVFELDLTAPDKLQMFDAIYYSSTVAVTWSPCANDDLLNYKLYISTSEGYWGREIISGLFTPYIIPASSVQIVNGECYYEIENMKYGKTYFFRVSAVDESFNEGEKSNVVSVTLPANAAQAESNMYYLKGNPFTGIYLDRFNSQSGNVDDMYIYGARFDVDVFDSGRFAHADPNISFDLAVFGSGRFAPFTARYVSEIFRSYNGFKHVKMLGFGKIGFRYRTYSGDNAGAWSDEFQLAAMPLLSLGGAKGLQIEAWYYSAQYSDNDYMKIEVA